MVATVLCRRALGSGNDSSGRRGRRIGQSGHAFFSCSFARYRGGRTGDPPYRAVWVQRSTGARRISLDGFARAVAGNAPGAQRAANQRRTALHPRGSLPHALPHGAATLDSWQLGNRQQRPPPPLLSLDRRGEEKSLAYSPRMGGAVPRFAPAYEGAPCLIGKNSLARSFPASHWMLPRRMKSTRNSPRIWKISTNRCELKVYQSKRRFNKRWRKLRTGRICGAKS